MNLGAFPWHKQSSNVHHMAYKTCIEKESTDALTHYCSNECANQCANTWTTIAGSLVMSGVCSAMAFIESDKQAKSS